MNLLNLIMENLLKVVTCLTIVRLIISEIEDIREQLMEKHQKCKS